MSQADADDDVRFGILGPLVVWRQDAAVALPRAKQRALLALLLTEAGRTVSSDRIVDVLWPDDQPQKAMASVHAYVSNLRKLLEPQRSRATRATLLVSEPVGYRLAVSVEQVDADRFERKAVAVGRYLSAGDGVRALDESTEALAMWRGAALEEFRGQGFAEAPATRLEELRRTCEEDRAEAMGLLGLHASAVTELEVSVLHEPLRERRWALLMRHLYLSGRQADALERYGRLRSLLREELGLDPSPELQALERRVLTQDVSMGWTDMAPEQVAISRSATSRAVSSRATVGSAPPSLVERSVELEELRRAVEEVVGGSPRVIVIDGEAGVGKTALIRAAMDRCAEAGVAVGWASCHEDAGAPSLWPWLQILESLDAAPPIPPDLDAFGSLALLSESLVHRAHQGPVACIVEDVHWADPLTLRLLAFLAVELRDVPVLLAVTVRTDERRDVVAGVMAALQRHAGALSLSPMPLSPNGTEALAHQIGGEELEGIERLYERTGGNPLFVTQLTRLIVTHGAGAGVPSGVREVIGQRLRKLSDETNSLLRFAALGGDDLDIGVLAASAELSIDRAVDVLDPPITAGILRIVGGGSIVFAHSLVRETVLDSMTDVERRQLHARLARTLARQAPSGANRIVRAHHAANAVPFVAAHEARDAAIDAARAAEETAAFGVAVHWWRRAIELADASSERKPGERGHLLLSLAAAHHRDGADDSAQAVIVEVLDEAALVGDAELAVTAAAALGRTGGEWLWARPGSDPRPLLERLERVVDDLDRHDDRSRALVLGTLSMGQVFIDNSDGGDVLSAEALAAARRCGDLALVARALSVRWRVIWRPGRAAEQLEIGGELAALAQRLSDHDLQLSASMCLHVAHLTLAEVDEATVELGRVLRMSREHHLPLVEAQVLPQVVSLEVLRGDLPAAERAIEATTRSWRRIEFGGEEAGAGLRTILLWLVRREQGREAELVDDIESYLAGPPASDVRWRAIAHVANGRLDAARACLVGPDIGCVSPWFAGGAYAVLDAELIADLGLVERAPIAVVELQRVESELALLGTAGCLGPIALALGRVAALQERPEVAEPAYRRALALGDRTGLRTVSIWSRVRLAELLADIDGRRDEAVELADGAARDAQRLGLTRAAAMAAVLR